jgi:outer membrane protein
MKKFLVLASAAAFILLATIDNVTADSIKGKLGVTGKIGFLIPNDNDYAPIRNNFEGGLIIGGGFIYGIDDRFAAEFEITHGDYNLGFGVTNISLGGQYRFVLEQSKLVPYLGTGLDLVMTYADQGRDVDTTVGFHASGGIDYFIMKELALIGEARIVIAPEADIKGPSGKLGNFDPTNFSTTVGVRYFFN